MSMEFNEIKVFLVCPECRKSFYSGDFRAPCPNCGAAEKWDVYFGGHQIADFTDYREVFELLVKYEADEDDMCMAAIILGYEHGAQQRCLGRNDVDKLKAYFKGRYGDK